MHLGCFLIPTSDVVVYHQIWKECIILLALLQQCSTWNSTAEYRTLKCTYVQRSMRKILNSQQVHWSITQQPAQTTRWDLYQWHDRPEQKVWIVWTRAVWCSPLQLPATNIIHYTMRLRIGVAILWLTTAAMACSCALLLGISIVLVIIPSGGTCWCVSMTHKGEVPWWVLLINQPYPDLVSADIENSWPWTTEKARLLPYLHCVYGYFDGMPLWNVAILLRLHPLLAESKKMAVWQSETSGMIILSVFWSTHRLAKVWLLDVNDTEPQVLWQILYYVQQIVNLLDLLSTITFLLF